MLSRRALPLRNALCYRGHNAPSPSSRMSMAVARAQPRLLHQHSLRLLSSTPSLPKEDVAGTLVHNDELTAADVLVERGLRVAYEVDKDSSVLHAMRLLTERRVGSALATATKENGTVVVGVFTARDLLRFVYTSMSEGGLTAAESLNTAISKVMTPGDKVAWCAPRDSLKRVRLLMRELGVRNLPVLSNESSEVLGMLTAKDIADFSLERTSKPGDFGGKESFMRAASGRTGLPSNYKMVESSSKRRLSSILLREGGSSFSEHSFARPDQPSDFFLSVGSCALPHPFKREDGSVANRRRDFGAEAPSDDATRSEDAHLVHTSKDRTFVAVFDGVGSWRKWGVDPRNYPRALAKHVTDQVNISSCKPFNILSAAWRRVTKEKIVGSCTACLVTLDHDLNQLSYANLGDSGIVVLRQPQDSRTAGTAALNAVSGTTRTAVLVASQQLRDFNLPYQLGFTEPADGQEEGAFFETPSQANVGAFPVLESDVVIVASDGLFDNLAVGDIADVVAQWEKDHASGSNLDGLASKLCNVARDRSLDEHHDSPFALLAKENDIMYGGGMPDDITVIALRVDSL